MKAKYDPNRVLGGSCTNMWEFAGDLGAPDGGGCPFCVDPGPGPRPLPIDDPLPIPRPGGGGEDDEMVPDH